MKAVKDISYASFDACKLDLYLPEPFIPGTPVYVSIHGGGLEAGDKRDAGREGLAERLTGQGIAMASINYRMYPQARYPDYLNDAASAVAFLLKEYPQFGNVAIGGESAGGYITQMLYFNKAFLENAGVDRSRLRAFIMDAGQPTTHFNILKYERGMDGRTVVIDRAAALYYLTEAYAHPEQEPYVAIFAADRDMVNRLEQNKMLETAMLHFGFPREKLLFYVFEDHWHCGYCGTESYIQRVTAFLVKAFEK